MLQVVIPSPNLPIPHFPPMPMPFRRPPRKDPRPYIPPLPDGGRGDFVPVPQVEPRNSEAEPQAAAELLDLEVRRTSERDRKRRYRMQRRLATGTDRPPLTPIQAQRARMSTFEWTRKNPEKKAAQNRLAARRLAETYEGHPIRLIEGFPTSREVEGPPVEPLTRFERDNLMAKFFPSCNPQTGRITNHLQESFTLKH